MSRLDALLGVGLACLLMASTACADDSGDTGAITVLAAASLTESFTELAAAFEDANPGVSVTLGFAASSELATQINEGAPADVFASADEANMIRVVDGIGTRSEPEVFATSSLQIIVEAGNPMGIASIADLADPDLVFVTAAPEVPIGRYTLDVLTAAGVEVTPRSLESSVSGIVSKVTLGEADAGIVYETDVRAAGERAEGVAIPAEVNVVARYLIAVPAESGDQAAADAFIEFVVSDAGQAILASFGFTSP